MVAERLTSVPGSSDVFLGSVVAYANDVKRDQLGVPSDVLEQHGAVSAETAEAMARGARERLRADVAVSVTGIAGPDGGTPEKPVGLVYMAAESPEGDLARDFTAPADRESIRRRATVMALHLVRALLERDEVGTHS
jgi:nicotinamide-nucleotide amidase